MAIPTKYTGFLKLDDTFQNVNCEEIVKVVELKKGEKTHNVKLKYVHYKGHKLDVNKPDLVMPAYDFEKLIERKLWKKI